MAKCLIVDGKEYSGVSPNYTGIIKKLDNVNGEKGKRHFFINGKEIPAEEEYNRLKLNWYTKS